MYLSELEITNFRRLASVKLKFEKGLNIILGPNNVGKSAVIEALRSLLAGADDPYLMGWAARLQRQRILENTAHGRERARQRGVKFGRKPKLGPHTRRKVLERRAQGESCAAIARELGVSESTISRIQG